ncbi:MAG: hypothetical protein OXI73_11295, partial [Rhodospirillales bacterium]|nr:hypothetical protein [Rhodospirillales bacterium]
MRNRLAKRRSHDRKGACRLLLPLLLATLPALQAAAQEVVEVEARRNSPLTGDATIGQERRLLFVTSTTTDATSDDIDDYNDHVIAAARDGIEAIRPHAGLFRAWVSTPTVDARDNANLKFGSLAPVHWLGSLQRIGINGADMYDAVWLNAGGHDENGNRLAPDLGLPRGQNRYIWTGSDNNGTRWCNSQKTVCFGLGDGIRAHAGDLKMVNPLSSTPKDSINEYPLYAVSPIFRAVPVVSIDLGRAAGVVDRTVNLNLRVRGLGVAATTKTEVRIRVTDDPLVDLLKASDEGTRDI